MFNRLLDTRLELMIFDKELSIGRPTDLNNTYVQSFASGLAEFWHPEHIVSGHHHRSVKQPIVPGGSVLVYSGLNQPNSHITSSSVLQKIADLFCLEPNLRKCLLSLGNW